MCVLLISPILLHVIIALNEQIISAEAAAASVKHSIPKKKTHLLVHSFPSYGVKNISYIFVFFYSVSLVFSPSTHQHHHSFVKQRLPPPSTVLLLAVSSNFQQTEAIFIGDSTQRAKLSQR